MFVLFPPTVASGLTVNARLADVLVVLLLSGWQRTERVGCITLNGGLLHIVLPLGPYRADGRVGQALVPYLVLRRKTAFLVSFGLFPATGSTAERVRTQSNPGSSPLAAAGFPENLPHGEALGRRGAKRTAAAANY